jgi:hypothetical protein
MSVWNYHSTLCNISEECRSHVLHKRISSDLTYLCAKLKEKTLSYIRVNVVFLVVIM